MTDYEIQEYVNKAVDGLRTKMSQDIFELHAICGVQSHLLQMLYAMQFREKDADFKALAQTMVARARMNANNADSSALTRIHQRHEQLLDEFGRNVIADLKAMKR